MAKTAQQLYEKFDKKHRKMIHKGFLAKKVFPYPQELFDRLRPFCVGGFPASIMLFVNETCNGHCYDRAKLMQLALENCKVVHADINSLRFKASGHSPQHAFVETTDFGGNKTWVIDTSIGLIFEKKYYYKLENPKINSILTKDQCMQSPEIQGILACNFENDKYILPTALPFIEDAIKASNHIGTLLYKDKIEKEIESFKQAIKFDQIRQEIDDDLETLRTNPSKLDEKFGIVRDEHGREMSRNGVPNPYYKSVEEMQKENEYYQSIKDNPEKLTEFFAEIDRRVSKEMAREESITSMRASQKLQEVAQNPTANFYDISFTPQNNPSTQDCCQ